jgi:hypothetical protein
MDQKTGSRLLSKRNILGGVLVAGIVAGLYLGDFWKGFGGGSTVGVGVGDPTPPKSPKESDPKVRPSEDVGQPVNKSDKEPVDAASENVPVDRTHDPVVVVIDDRSYYVRSSNGDHKTELKQVVSLAKAKPRGKGIRIHIYRRLSSRTAAEIALRDALDAAGINENETAWAPTPLDANEAPPETKTPR